MPIDLLGKAHKTIIIEGVNILEHEDCAKYVTNICGPCEVWDSVEGKDGVARLWIIFKNVPSVDVACSRLEGTTFQFAENVMNIRRADEKTAVGKSILSTYSTAAVLAPRSALAGGGGPNGTEVKIAGLLGAARGTGTTATAVRNAAAQRANTNAMMVSLLSSGNNTMQLLLGGPQGWKVGDKNDNVDPNAGKKKTSGGEEEEEQDFLAEAEAQLQADIAKNATIKTSTSNLLKTEAEVAATRVIHIPTLATAGSSSSTTGGASSSDPLFALGNKSVPASMQTTDVDFFMNEHLRRQCDALLVLGGAEVEALEKEIEELKKTLAAADNEAGSVGHDAGAAAEPEKKEDTREDVSREETDDVIIAC